MNTGKHILNPPTSAAASALYPAKNVPVYSSRLPRVGTRVAISGQSRATWNSLILPSHAGGPPAALSKDRKGFDNGNINATI